MKGGREVVTGGERQSDREILMTEGWKEEGRRGTVTKGGTRYMRLEKKH